MIQFQPRLLPGSCEAGTDLQISSKLKQGGQAFSSPHESVFKWGLLWGRQFLWLRAIPKEKDICETLAGNIPSTWILPDT